MVEAGGNADQRADNLRLDVIVAEAYVVAEGTKIFELRRMDAGPMPYAAPGSHIDVFLPSGLVRQYSIASSSAELDYYRIAVARNDDGRGGSREMHQAVSPGKRLLISTPRSNFPLKVDAAHSVFIAGGIGITPIWPMIQQLQLQGASWQLHYGCRSHGHAVFLDDIRSLGERASFYFSEEGPSRRADIPSVVADAPPESHFYCCGPSRMLSAFSAATALLPKENVHIEHFVPGEALAASSGFWIDLHKSGKSLYVPAGGTILKVLLEAGIDVNHSCEIGLCGSCEVGVVDGVPDHRDEFLSPGDRVSNARIMVCCSGAISERLVLNL